MARMKKPLLIFYLIVTNKEQGRTLRSIVQQRLTIIGIRVGKINGITFITFAILKNF